MKILVTVGAGFISSAPILRLLERGVVIGIGKYNDYYKHATTVKDGIQWLVDWYPEFYGE